MARIEISGLQEFLERIDNKQEVETALNKGLKKVVFFMEGEVIPFTPVDKGFLRNSYKQKYGKLFGTLFNTRDYAMYVHEGTRYIKGNPFLTKAVDKNKSEVNLIFNEELQDSLKILKK